MISFLKYGLKQTNATVWKKTDFQVILSTKSLDLFAIIIDLPAHILFLIH